MRVTYIKQCIYKYLVSLYDIDANKMYEQRIWVKYNEK